MVCVLSVFSFFLSFFSFFYWYFSWQKLTVYKIGGTGKGIIIFLVFHFHPVTNIHLINRYFWHLVTRSICNYQTDSWWDLFSLDVCILFAFIRMQLSRSYFKVTSWVFDLLSNYQTLLLQSECYNSLRFTLLATTVYLSHLPIATTCPLAFRKMYKK